MDSAQFIHIHGNLTELNLNLKKPFSIRKEVQIFQTYIAERIADTDGQYASQKYVLSSLMLF